MKLIQQPTGIIKTMPASWLKALPNGICEWEKTFMSMNRFAEQYWIFNLSGKPKHQVLYFYLLFDRAIRYRANIIGYEPSHEQICYDGSFHDGKVWVQVAAPIIKLKNPVPYKGFQGFRYSEEIYE